MKYLIKRLSRGIPFLLFVPLAAAAQGTLIDSALNRLWFTLNLLISLLMVAATVVFLWGVIKFISAAGDPTSREKAKGIMTWGIIGLAVMAAAWGIANLLINYFLGGSGASPQFIAPPVVN